MNKTSLAIPWWCTTALCGSRLPITAMLSVYPAFSCTGFSLSAKLLVSQGWAPTAYSCISTLRCQATAVSSEPLCVYHAQARCWNTRNSRDGVSMSWLSLMCRRTTSGLLVYPHSFTRVDTSKRSAPRHCALLMCSIARNLTYQANSKRRCDSFSIKSFF